MPYSSNEYKETNINYLNKDFPNIKNSLINYAKTYFPNTYKDFNETSPGMMMLELSAYVGDVLSFYIDQQYREMMLPLAEERRNVNNIAKMLGYKPKVISPAFVDLTFTQIVDSVTGDESKINYASAGAFDKGIKITATSNSDVIFETLEEVDFTISASNGTDTAVINSTTALTGLASNYRISRTVKAISAETKTKEFTVNQPSKFMRLSISDTNVIEIISVVDSNNNNWYEVEYLAQDKIPISIPYYNNSYRNNDAYMDEDNQLMATEVRYSLEYIQTNKRFIIETNEDSTTSLVFGNGLLRNGIPLDSSFLDMEQLGVTIPGQTNDLTDSIDPLLGDDYETLGESPAQTTLTVSYRVGGGIKANVISGDLISFSNSSRIAGAGTINSVTNEKPAAGGRNQDTISEIKERTKSFFATQNRCVTKEDYEARVLNVPAKFGNIAKVYVARSLEVSPASTYGPDIALASNSANEISSTNTSIINTIGTLPDEPTLDEYLTVTDSIESALIALQNDFVPDVVDTLANLDQALETTPLGSISIYILSYDRNKNLLGNPSAVHSTSNNDGVPSILMQNVTTYLENFKLLTDVVDVYDGFIINFGVIFDVIAHSQVNKQEVKLRCIQKIKDYFRVENMQFGQPIHVSNLEYELMGIDGVRSIKEVKLTQQIKDINLYRYSIFSDGSIIDESVAPVSADNPSGTVGYGYKYDFSHSWNLGTSPGIVLPPHPNNPAVFELKNPNENIIGVAN